MSDGTYIQAFTFTVGGATVENRGRWSRYGKSGLGLLDSLHIGPNGLPPGFDLARAYRGGEGLRVERRALFFGRPVLVTGDPDVALVRYHKE